MRGFIAAHYINHTGLYPVQLLDGIGAGLQSVAVPGLVAHLLNDTGRVNIGQGAVMTVQGLGASLSPAIGGWMAQQIGYPSTFLILGSFAFISIGLWILVAATLKSACDTTGADVVPAWSCGRRPLASSLKTKISIRNRVPTESANHQLNDA